MDSSLFDDRRRLGNWLIGIGVVGLAASLVVGVVGWLLADRATGTVSRAIEPVAGIVDDLAESIEASEVLFENTTKAIESIEAAARSTVQTLDSVGTVVADTSAIAGEGVADSIDGAVETLPGLISTAGVVDTTMRALSLVGVDYDPAVPLDESLADLQDSLAPLPGQIREQVDLLEDVEADLDRIAEDGRNLSGVLLNARLDMIDAERVLRSARRNAASAAETVELVESEVAGFEPMGRLVVTSAALALLAASLAPLLMGMHLRRSHQR